MVGPPACWLKGADADVKGPTMGELDPRFHIRAPLRCDGIGRLDCAEDTESGVRMAVRWLPIEANGEAAVKACEKLPEHPTLPRIRQTGQVGTSVFVAMDFPEGRLLSTLGGERLDIDIVLRVGAQLSDALATVHEQGVMHGELSADSVLLVPPDRAYLWDMPLVIANRMTDRRGESRLMQNLVKTAAYLAPERARGGEATREADVYALGVVLCTSAGAPLPVSTGTLGVVHQVATGGFQCRVPTTLPDPWFDVLVRMVSADPAQRPSAREVAQVFARVPQPASLPTVPEFPAVRLPPELLAAADALSRQADREDDARKTVEMPMVVPVDAHPTAPTAKAPVVAAPAPEPTVVAQVLAPTVSADDIAEVSQADVLKLPTMELPAVQAALAVEPPAPSNVVPLKAVQLTESVSVSPDLAQAGARAVTLEVPLPPDAPPVATDKRWVWAMAAAAALVAAVAVGLLVKTMSSPETVAAPAVVPPAPVVVAPVVVPAPRPSPVVVEAVVTTPTPVSVLVEEELAPLPPPRLHARTVLSPRASLAPRRALESPVVSGPVLPASPSAAPVVEHARPQSADYGFLEGGEAPSEPLKRPRL